MPSLAPQAMPDPADDTRELIDAVLARLDKADQVLAELCSQMLAPPP
jgi:hypothetical protein